MDRRVALVDNVVRVVGKSAHVRRNRRYRRCVRQIVVATARGHRSKGRFVQDLSRTRCGIPVALDRHRDIHSHLLIGIGRECPQRRPALRNRQRGVVDGRLVA